MKNSSKTTKETAESKDLVGKSKSSSKKNLVSEDVKTSDGKSSGTEVNNKKFEKDDLLKFKLLETKYQNAQMFIQLKTHEFEKAKAAWETHGRELLSEIEKGQVTFQNTMNELSELRAELEKKYSINMSRISYHEATGVIYEH